MRAYLVLAAVALLLCGCGCGKPAAEVTATAPAAAPVALTIWHFNDFHAAWNPLTRPADAGGDGEEEWSGAVAMAARLQRARAADANCLVLFAGDMFLANSIDARTKGASTVELLRRLRPDAAAMGNHELDYGRPRLQELMARIDWPLLAANVAYRGEPLCGTSTIVERNGLRILVIGLFPESGARYYEQDHGVEISEALPAVTKAVRAAAGDIDLTVILSHLGDDDDAALAKKLPADLGVDLIVGGHTHIPLAEPVVENGIPIVQAGANGEYLGKLVLAVDAAANTCEVTTYELQPALTDGMRDAEAERLLAAEMKEVEAQLAPVATLSAPLWNSSRFEETPLGNFVVDAYVDAFRADLAFVDSKGLRRYVPGPALTEFHLRSAMTGTRTLHRVTMTGANVQKFLEYYLQRGDRHISIPYTLAYTYTGTGRNARINGLTFRGQPLDMRRAYAVIAEDMLVDNLVRHNGATGETEVAPDAAAAILRWAKQQRTVTVRAGGRTERTDGRAPRAPDRLPAAERDAA